MFYVGAFLFFEELLVVLYGVLVLGTSLAFIVSLPPGETNAGDNCCDCATGDGGGVDKFGTLLLVGLLVTVSEINSNSLKY